MNERVKLLLFFLIITFAIQAETSEIDLSLELRKNLCLTSSPIFDQSSSQSLFDFLDKNSQVRTSEACYEYLMNGGKDLKAIELMFQSHILLLRWPYKAFDEYLSNLDEVRKEEYRKSILDLAKENQEMSLWANAVIVFEDFDNDVIKKSQMRMIDQDFVLLPYLLLDPELNITQSLNQETRDQIGLNTKNAFARYYYVDYLQDPSLFPFTNQQLNSLIENDEMIHLHYGIAEQFFKNGDENLGLLHTYLRGVRGNDLDKLYTAIHVLKNSSQYWAGDLALRLLASIEDIDSISAVEETAKVYLQALMMISGNPSYKDPDDYRSLGSFDPYSTRLLFDDYLKKFPDSNLEYISNDLAIRIDEELVKLAELFERYRSSKNLSPREKSMLGSIYIREGNTEVGLDLLIAAAKDGNVAAYKGLSEAFRFLNTQEREKYLLFLKQKFLEGSKAAEYFLTVPCDIVIGSAASKGIHYPVPEHAQIIDSIVDCNDLSKKSDLMQFSLTRYKIINEDYRLSNREYRNIKSLRDSHSIYEDEANEVLLLHYWRNDKKKALELIESVKEPENLAFYELDRLLVEAGKTEQAFNIIIKSILRNGSLSLDNIDDYGTPEILEAMILGSEDLWRNLEANQGEGYALVNTIYSDIINTGFDSEIEEKIYRYDLTRESIQAMNDYGYYYTRAQLASDIGDSVSFFSFKDALENICGIEEHDRCKGLKVLDLLADANLNNQESLKLKMSELTNRFQQDPKYIETNIELFGYWVYLVADNHLFELEDQYLEILKELTKSDDFDFTEAPTAIVNYAYIALRNGHCRGYDDIIDLFDLSKTDYSEDDFTADNMAFESFSLLLLWSESCGKLDGSFLSLKPITYNLFSDWLSYKDYGLAARAVSLFSENNNKEFALLLGLELIESLKKDATKSILLGENPYLTNSTKARDYLRFFTDFLNEEYINQRIDKSTYNEAMLEISLLSGLSSITQSLIQQRAIDQINSDSLENTLAELREIRSELEKARENIILIDGKKRDQLLLNLAKSKNIIRDEYKNFGNLDLFPSDLLKVIQSGLETDEVIILFIDGNESRYTLQITNEDLEISSNNRSSYPDWRSLKKELSQYNQRDLINNEFNAYSDLLLTNALPSDIETIIFVPSPELLGFPFKALTLPQTVTVNARKIASENRFLIQNYNITSAFSVLEAAQITNESSNEGSIFNSLLAFANPLSSEIQTEAYDLNFDTYRSATSIKKTINYLAPLPESEDEVRAISGFFKESVIYTGSNATANKFLSEDLSNFSHIIFATHALKPNEIEGIMTSAIVLTPTKEDLGLITPAMISGLDFSSQHISLSACSTSAPELNNGEIYSGFVKSFIEAGAGSVFFTEWEVETNTATFINEGTYRFMSKGYDPNLALTKAIREFLSAEDDRFVHPSFWAPFQILSN